MGDRIGAREGQLEQIVPPDGSSAIAPRRCRRLAGAPPMNFL